MLDAIPFLSEHEHIKKGNGLKLLTALFVLSAFSAQAATLVDTSTALSRSASVTSASATFFKLDQTRRSVIEVSGTGGGTLKVSGNYTTTPTTYNGFVPDPDGSVTANTGWELPAGLSFVGFDSTSGTWTMRVSQPK